MKLAYYSTRRDRRDGWMQLELRRRRVDDPPRQPDRRVRASWSSASALAAAARELELSAATIANLEALGIETPVLSDFGRTWREAGRERSAADPRPSCPLCRAGRVYPRGQRRVVPRAAALDGGAGRQIRLGQIGRQPGDHAHPAAQRARSPRARSCSPIRAATAPRSTSPDCRPTAPRCGRSAAAASRSSSRSR